MEKFCQSCGVPLSSEYKGLSDKYCKYCTDAAGKLKARAGVQKGIATWLKSWQPGITEKQAMDRAAHYMLAMPAWAED